MLSERSQTTKGHIIFNYIKCLEKANLQSQTVDSSCSGWGWGQGLTMNGCEEGSYWDDENVPRLDYDNGCTIW